MLQLPPVIHRSGSRVQIIIPMSGYGERFRRAGYAVPKPLIEIDGKPIIAHVVDLFPDETDFLFICNEEHLANPDFRMEAILRQYCPSSRILGIPPHKLGPVHAVRQAAHLIDKARPAIVNYCDFTCLWDWGHFRSFVQAAGCDGAIPAYKGFHPHTLGSTNYAYMRNEKGWVTDIQEKQPYTDNRMEEYASSGSYYFASGAILLDALRVTMEQRLNIGGEYYMSLAYKPMLAAGKQVAVYPLQHFMQWGTPEDVAEYRGWSDAFRHLSEASPHREEAMGAVVVPMAGLGQRFADEGYTLTKPLIPVSGKPMVVQAANDLPNATHHAFVLRADMPGYKAIAQILRETHPNAVVETIPAVTEGQAITARIGLDALGEIDGPITFGACDNGMLYDSRIFRKILEEANADVIVWGARGHANATRRPQMFGWIDAEEDGHIRGISVKTPLENPARDPIVIGAFTFRKTEDFRRALDRLVARDGRVNGEFYLDACINDAIALGLTCRLFEVDHFLSWGTPNDLRTFEYWQSCFHQWPSHPYRLEKDARVPPEAVSELAAGYLLPPPSLPGVQP